MMPDEVIGRTITDIEIVRSTKPDNDVLKITLDNGTVVLLVHAVCRSDRTIEMQSELWRKTDA